MNKQTFSEIFSQEKKFVNTTTSKRIEALECKNQENSQETDRQTNQENQILDAPWYRNSSQILSAV